ncbi:hypothetical protein ACHAWO_012954 [Cyclotella atomus]|uniref:Uncharacterized protein n=1 Tax=Cyclotella atomus TaxID=382360 RepID=A0ABD3PQQ6_9STRA
MSFMTESLLLQAQSLRLDGDIHTSIHLLRTVLSQCNSDIQAAAASSVAATAADGGEDIAADIAMKMKAVCRMRQMAAYQLALLLLQRHGRCCYMNRKDVANCNTQADNGVGDTETQTDEKEADDLLCRLGYRLRLSTRAFGYPSCSCRCTTTSESSSQLPLRVMDDVLPLKLFEALQYAFRPDSMYWKELYSKVNIGNNSCWVEGGSNDGQSTERNQFVSHNIDLPRGNPSQSLQNANSIIEQVAIITKYKLMPHFPELQNAKSVEVWCHQRPTDGSHQLHYDMDEIRLQERRERLLVAAAQTQRKRQKVDVSDRDQGKNDGIFCPMVSCVLTIYVPNNSHACSNCGETSRAAPTIICNQSILNINQTETNCHTNDDEKGWLCYPKPNRLLAFEGSLLHGVVPGIPEHDININLHTSDNDSDESNDGYSNDPNNQQQRVTLMMGFWANGVSIQDMSLGIGPNMPFPMINDSGTSWAKEFEPIQMQEDELEGTSVTNSITTAAAVIEVNPLWTPIHRDSSNFGEYINDNAMTMYFSGRFFLRSVCTREIDDEIIHNM